MMITVVQAAGELPCPGSCASLMHEILAAIIRRVFARGQCVPEVGRIGPSLLYDMLPAPRGDQVPGEERGDDDRRGDDEPEVHGYLVSAFAIAIALSGAADLLIVSWCSVAGSESATRPAPAWTVATPFLITAVRIAIARSASPARSK